MAHARDDYHDHAVPLELGKLSVSPSIKSKVNERLINGKRSGIPRRTTLSEIIEAGLANLETRSATATLSDALYGLQRVLAAANELDIRPHPCPAAVDPKWWAEKEAERTRDLSEQRDKAVKEGLRLVTQARKAVGGL